MNNDNDAPSSCCSCAESRRASLSWPDRDHLDQGGSESRDANVNPGYNSNFNSAPSTIPQSPTTSTCRRSSFEQPLHPLHATIVFVDLEGYSKVGDAHQHRLTRDFMDTLRNLLAFAYGELPVRSDIGNYVVLPTGDGAAVIVIRPPRRAIGAPTETGCVRNHVRVDRLAFRAEKETAAASEPPPGITCHHCSETSLRTTSETALWLGSSLLLWAHRRSVGLRVGLNSGLLSVVEDPYGDPNVCGDAINMAARIMDTASPGQILASAETVVPGLNALRAEAAGGGGGRDCRHCPRMAFDVAAEASEVVVKHGVTSNVQSVTCSLRALPGLNDLPEELESESSAPPPPRDSRAGKKMRQRSFASLSSSSSCQHQEMQDRMSAASISSEELVVRPVGAQSSASDGAAAASSAQHPQQESTDSFDQRRPHRDEQQRPRPISGPQRVGHHKTPATKWYMKIKPTEMHSSDNQIRPKVLPRELVRRHKRIAFLGIMHDNISKGFVNILNEDPTHRWEQVYVLFPSDACLRDNLATNYRDCSVEQLVANKRTRRRLLSEILSPVVGDLRFLQYDQLMHCGSYWDWREPGGFIHVSPLTWGANPKTCPAMNYYWNSRVCSPEYMVYRDGLEYLLGTAKEFDDERGEM